MTTRLYVGHIPYEARERDVERFLRGFGPIRDILMKRGYCFVEMDDPRDVEDAVYDLNGRTLMGMRVTVEAARGRPYRPSSRSPRRRSRSPRRRSRSPKRRRSRSRSRSVRRGRSISESRSRSRSPIKKERDSSREKSSEREKSVSPPPFKSTPLIHEEMPVERSPSLSPTSPIGVNNSPRSAKDEEEDSKSLQGVKDSPRCLKEGAGGSKSPIEVESSPGSPVEEGNRSPLDDGDGHFSLKVEKVDVQQEQDDSNHCNSIQTGSP